MHAHGLGPWPAPCVKPSPRRSKAKNTTYLRLISKQGNGVTDVSSPSVSNADTERLTNSGRRTDRPARLIAHTEGRPAGPPMQVLGQCGTNGEGRQVGICPVDIDGADILDRHPVDRIDFRSQQRGETFIGQSNGEFVDDTTCSLFENFDRQHIATYRADSTRDLTEGSWTIGHPDPDNDNSVHGQNVSIGLTSFVTTRLPLRFASHSPRGGSLSPVLGDRA